MGEPSISFGPSEEESWLLRGENEKNGQWKENLKAPKRGP